MHNSVSFQYVSIISISFQYLFSIWIFYRAWIGSNQYWHFLKYGNWKHVFQFLYSSIPINFFWNTIGIWNIIWNTGILKIILEYWNLIWNTKILKFYLQIYYLFNGVNELIYWISKSTDSIYCNIIWLI